MPTTSVQPFPSAAPASFSPFTQLRPYTNLVATPAPPATPLTPSPGFSSFNPGLVRPLPGVPTTLPGISSPAPTPSPAPPLSVYPIAPTPAPATKQPCSCESSSAQLQEANVTIDNLKKKASEVPWKWVVGGALAGALVYYVASR